MSSPSFRVRSVSSSRRGDASASSDRKPASVDHTLPGVQQIETAIGKADFFAPISPGKDSAEGGIDRSGWLETGRLIKSVDFRLNIFGIGHRGSGFTHHDSGRNVGKLRRVDRRQARRDTGS